MTEEKLRIDIEENGVTDVSDRPRVRGTAIGGLYISPRELFTTKAGREAIRNLIRVAELEKSKSNRHDRA